MFIAVLSQSVLVGVVCYIAIGNRSEGFFNKWCWDNQPSIHSGFGEKGKLASYCISFIKKFPNGSKIQAVTSNDNSRGLRGNILVCDEFRMIDKDIVEKVLQPMLNVARQPGYLRRPEYKDYKTEENKEISF